MSGYDKTSKYRIENILYMKLCKQNIKKIAKGEYIKRIRKGGLCNQIIYILPLIFIINCFILCNAYVSNYFN